MVVSVTIIRILLVMTAISLKIIGLYCNEYFAGSARLDFYNSDLAPSIEKVKHSLFIGVVWMARSHANLGAFL